MPIRRCKNGKWRIGSGKCIYTSKASARKAYKAYLAKENAKFKKEQSKKTDFAKD